MVRLYKDIGFDFKLKLFSFELDEFGCAFVFIILIMLVIGMIIC
jgi:hypothetical protein